MRAPSERSAPALARNSGPATNSCMVLRSSQPPVPISRASCTCGSVRSRLAAMLLHAGRDVVAGDRVPQVTCSAQDSGVHRGPCTPDAQGAGHACPPVAQLGLARERCHSNDLSGSSVLRRTAAHCRSPGGEGGGQREQKREALHALWTHATRAWLAERLSQRTIA